MAFDSFNLPGRFGFGRTSALPRRRCAPQVSICQADLGLAELVFGRDRGDIARWFQSARQIWVWPNLNLRRLSQVRHNVSICQADLGLAELLPFSLRMHTPIRFNLPGRFGFGRTGAFSTNEALVTCFNLPGRFGFGRTRTTRLAGQIRGGFNLPGRFGFGRTIGLGSALLAPKVFQSARQIWVWPNSRRSITRAPPG